MQVPPQHAWEAMAQYAPEAAELACQSLDIASAQSYFAGVRGCTYLLACLSPACQKEDAESHVACLHLLCKLCGLPYSCLMVLGLQHCALVP